MARNAVKSLKYYMVKFIWMVNLMMRLHLHNYNFLGPSVTSQTPEKCAKYSKICKNVIKWQEMLSNAIIFVGVYLPGQGI